MSLLVFVLAGGLGAVLRYLAELRLSDLRVAGVACGVPLINITGCLALGLLTAALGDHRTAAHAAAGLLGGFTTLSTASVDTARLLAAGRIRAALGYAAGTLGLSVGAAAAGLALGQGLTGS